MEKRKKMTDLKNFNPFALREKYSAKSLNKLSILTFFLGPLVTRPFMNDHPDQCIAGFLLGFTVSIFLWMKFGRKLSKK